LIVETRLSLTSKPFRDTFTSPNPWRSKSAWSTHGLIPRRASMIAWSDFGFASLP
jgi:hypothetical protein